VLNSTHSGSGGRRHSVTLPVAPILELAETDCALPQQPDINLSLIGHGGNFQHKLHTRSGSPDPDPELDIGLGAAAEESDVEEEVAEITGADIYIHITPPESQVGTINEGESRRGSDDTTVA